MNVLAIEKCGTSKLTWRMFTDMEQWADIRRRVLIGARPSVKSALPEKPWWLKKDVFRKTLFLTRDQPVFGFPAHAVFDVAAFQEELRDRNQQF